MRFVFFLQNHDQIGNRALGERIVTIADPGVLRVGVALMLLSPQIPLLFMGEERGAREPFLYFTNYRGDLAEAVKEGRRKEFGKFPEFSTPEAQCRIPDPNRLETFDMSRPDFSIDDDWARGWEDFYRRLIALRTSMITPRLDGVHPSGVEILSAKSLRAGWSLGDGSKLTLAMNFGKAPVHMPAIAGNRIFACGDVENETEPTLLPGRSFLAIMHEAR
jgi:maltooligosyltrehalose trehalohydrolase